MEGALTTLERRQLIAHSDGWYAATAAGEEIVAQVVEARRDRLAGAVSHWSAEEQQEFAHVVQRLARDLLHEAPREPAEAR